MIIGAATSPNTTTTTVSASVSSESTIVTTTNVSFDMTAGEIVKVSFPLLSFLVFSLPYPCCCCSCALLDG